MLGCGCGSLYLMANKVPIAKLTDALGLHEIKNRKWYIQSTCAVNGSGIYEGLDWMSDAVTSAPKH